MRNPHEKIIQGDHVVVAFKGNAMTLDNIVKELNILYEIGDISDDANKFDVENYNVSDVVDLHKSLTKIHDLIFNPKL